MTMAIQPESLEEVTHHPLDLSGVYLKLQRAETHIQSFHDEVAAFSNRDPKPFDFAVRETPGSNHSIEYNLYAVIREKPPHEMALPFGDAIQNIRSALDYLVYELAPPSVRRQRKTQFPIFTKEREFKEQSPRMLMGIKGDERTIIERVQPYAVTNPPSDDPLTVLQELSNRDKHRLLTPMIAAVRELDSWVASDNADIRFTYLARGAVEDGARIVAFTATPQDPAKDMNVYPQSGLEIQIGDTGIVGFDIGAVDLLRMIHHHVRWTILDMAFERRFIPSTWAEVQASQQ
jgi:hypothetical protein